MYVCLVKSDLFLSLSISGLFRSFSLQPPTSSKVSFFITTCHLFLPTITVTFDESTLPVLCFVSLHRHTTFAPSSAVIHPSSLHLTLLSCCFSALNNLNYWFPPFFIFSPLRVPQTESIQKKKENTWTHTKSQAGKLRASAATLVVFASLSWLIVSCGLIFTMSRVPVCLAALPLCKVVKAHNLVRSAFAVVLKGVFLIFLKGCWSSSSKPVFFKRKKKPCAMGEYHSGLTFAGKTNWQSLTELQELEEKVEPWQSHVRIVRGKARRVARWWRLTPVFQQ